MVARRLLICAVRSAVEVVVSANTAEVDVNAIARPAALAIALFVKVFE
jgi:hypothetical protein